MNDHSQQDTNRTETYTKTEAMEALNKEIEERKRLEKALEKERALLHTLIDTLPDHIYVKDSGSRFLLANDAIVRSMAVSTQDELLGKTDFDFHPLVKGFQV